MIHKLKSDFLSFPTLKGEKKINIAL